MNSHATGSLPDHRQQGGRQGGCVSPASPRYESSSVGRRLYAGLLAGALALGVNMAALYAADLAGVPTAHGGLLRLVATTFGVAVPNGAAVQMAFHILRGLVMAATYAVCCPPMWSRQPVILGPAVAAAVWLLNAAFVLPLTGEGFAGTVHTGPIGLLWFAVAHTVFFCVLAIDVARLAPPV